MPKRKRYLDNAGKQDIGTVNGMPVIVNGQPLSTEECALFANQALRDAGYLAQGNAWNSKGSDIIFNGYNTLQRPEQYDSLAVLNYNNAASDRVYKDFDSNTLDKSRPYMVNMYYKGSPYLKTAYEEGTQGRTGTHTGYLVHDGNQWNVVHNIHGKAHVDKFTNIQGGKRKYGVTAVFAPRKNSLLNNIKTRLGFRNGGTQNIKLNGSLEATRDFILQGLQTYDLPEVVVHPQNMLPEVNVTGYRPIELQTYYPLGKEYPYTGHSKLRIPISDNVSKDYGLVEKQYENIQPFLYVDKSSSAKDYNLVTNNCSDETLAYLNAIYNTQESPVMFTTPGDVRDYAINKLNGKVVKKHGVDTVLIPRNKSNADKLSRRALDYYSNKSDTRHSARIIMAARSGFRNGGRLQLRGGGKSKYWVDDSSILPELLVTPKGNNYVLDEQGNPAVTVGAIRDINPNAKIYERVNRELKNNQYTTLPTREQVRNYADAYANAVSPTIGDMIDGTIGRVTNLLTPSHYIGAVKIGIKIKV